MSSNTITVKNEETQNSANSANLEIEHTPAHTIYDNMLHAQRL